MERKEIHWVEIDNWENFKWYELHYIDNSKEWETNEKIL